MFNLFPIGYGRNVTSININSLCIFCLRFMSKRIIYQPLNVYRVSLKISFIKFRPSVLKETLKTNIQKERLQLTFKKVTLFKLTNLFLSESVYGFYSSHLIEGKT